MHCSKFAFASTMLENRTPNGLSFLGAENLSAHLLDDNSQSRAQLSPRFFFINNHVPISASTTYLTNSLIKKGISASEIRPLITKKKIHSEKKPRDSEKE